MSEYTEGPWSAYQRRHDETWSIEGGGDTIAYLCYLDEPTHDIIHLENAEANARLIAAAPELLAELEKASRQIDPKNLRNHLCPCCGASRAEEDADLHYKGCTLNAAIKKARGTA